MILLKDKKQRKYSYGYFGTVITLVSKERGFLIKKKLDFSKKNKENLPSLLTVY
jgi:general stress protein CsbA